MSTEEKQLSIPEVIDVTQERFLQIAPEEMKYEAEKGFAVQILKNNPYLMNVARNHTQSLQQALTNVAAIGLSLNPAEKQAYLIPRNVRVDTNKWESRVFLEPSYIGLCRLATDSGSIEWIQARCVYDKDDFIDKGVGEKPAHEYKAFSKERGEFVGVYCVAKTHTGDYLTTLLSKDEVESIRDRSESWKANKSGPWKTDFNEMAKKSVIRNAFKTWPRSVTSDRMAEAVHLSNENEGFEPIITSPRISEFTADQKEFFDQLIEKSDALGMYVFSDSFDLNDASGNGASIWTNLIHSFPKGEKGKYQALVEDLRAQGESSFVDILSEIEAQLGTDDFAVKEILEDLDDATIKLIEQKLPNEMVMEFAKVSQ